METVRPCGCKGIRSCLICEAEYEISKPDLKVLFQEHPSYVYCPHCDKAYPGWNEDSYKEHPNHSGKSIPYPGVYIQLDFLSEQEAGALMTSLDDLPWESSQSGRRKQNFGPKCNFKKRKLRLGNFNGFPASTQFVQEKLKKVPLLKDFQTIEQCTLEYDPLRGASIDPHIDDCWVWGERIVTVNVLGDSVLTMSKYDGPDSRYNLPSVAEYSSKLLPDGSLGCEDLINENYVVRLPMPARSLMILYGDSRYKWEHSVLREDVQSRRVCLAYRELTPPYLENSTNNIDDVPSILEQAVNFWEQVSSGNTPKYTQ